MKWTLLLLILMSTSFVKAKPQLSPSMINFIINQCYDQKGHKVDFLFHQDVDGDMYASTHQSMVDWEGNKIEGVPYLPVVRINMAAFLADSVPGQAFSLGHECGHQVLGHVLAGGDSKPGEEFDADCWAIHFLVKNRILTKKSEVLQIEKDFMGYYGKKPYHRSESHPGTLERFDHINRCFDEAIGKR